MVGFGYRSQQTGMAGLVPTHRNAAAEARAQGSTAGSGRPPLWPRLNGALRAVAWPLVRYPNRLSDTHICCGERGGNSKVSQKVREWVKLFRKTRWNSTRRAKDYLVDFFIAEHFIDNMRPSFLIYLYSILPSRMTTATNASSGVNNSRPSRHVAQHATAAAS